MRVIKLYKLGPEDPNWETKIQEAFNRVASFAWELESSTSKVPLSAARSFNRVTVNREFTLDDWIRLHEYGKQVVDRAINGANEHRRFRAEEMCAAIDQAALNLRDVLAEFDLWLATTKPLDL